MKLRKRNTISIKLKVLLATACNVTINFSDVQYVVFYSTLTRLSTRMASNA